MTRRKKLVKSIEILILRWYNSGDVEKRGCRK
jgi:hypothetical protein